MWNIGHQPGQNTGIGCAGASCPTAADSYSGVYKGGGPVGLPAQGGSGIIGGPAGAVTYYQQQPGLITGHMVPAQPVVGIMPIGNYMISQSVPTPARPVDFPIMATGPALNQRVLPPVSENRGVPTLGAGETLTDMGLTWRICRQVNIGFFNQNQCRDVPKFG